MKLWSVAALFAKSPDDFVLFPVPWVSETIESACAGAVDHFRTMHPDKSEYRLMTVAANAATPEQIELLRSGSTAKPAAVLHLVAPQATIPKELQNELAGIPHGPDGAA